MIPCASERDDDIRPGDPRWLGAWWLGVLLLAALTLPLIVGMSLFPPHLPDAPNKAVLAKKETQKKKVSPKGKSTERTWVPCLSLAAVDVDATSGVERV